MRGELRRQAKRAETRLNAVIAIRRRSTIYERSMLNAMLRTERFIIAPAGQRAVSRFARATSLHDPDHGIDGHALTNGRRDLSRPRRQYESHQQVSNQLPTFEDLGPCPRHSDQAKTRRLPHGTHEFDYFFGTGPSCCAGSEITNAQNLLSNIVMLRSRP